MDDRTLILHGWSDTADSFEALKAYLVARGAGGVETILYADYASREDAVTFNDLVDGLHRRLVERGIVEPDGTKRCDLDVVVHSTGGLVIRHWIWRYYRRDGDRIDACPVKRLVMLAPANFGSPLAHRGKSFLGSLLKGRKEVGDFLEVGRNLLSGLELASPYQWRLAERDVLVREPYFAPERIQLTVLVGADDYEGLRSLVDKKGTDGTVVIAGTPLHSVKFRLDPCRPLLERDDQAPYDWHRTESFVRAAFGVLPGYDHSSIRSSFADPDGEGETVGRCLLRALGTDGDDPGDFEELRGELRERTEATYRRSGKRAYQQFLVRAVDDQGAPVDDYTLEFLLLKAGKIGPEGWRRSVRWSEAEREWSETFHQAVSGEFHRHSENPSYRRFLVEPGEVARLREDASRAFGEPAVAAMRMHVPPVDRGIRYRTDRLEAVALAGTGDGGSAAAPSFFYPNTTSLVEIKVDRENDYVWVGTEPAAR